MSTPTKPPPSAGGPAEYTTPTKRVAYEAAGPSRRPQGASPAYSSRKHSLYGIEDRVVIDPGSRIWKVGFSGEPNPRTAFWVSPCRSPGSKGKSKGKDREVTEAWDLDLEDVFPDRTEASRMVGVRVQEKCREVFHKHLLTDPKSRKVIVLENTFLPAYVKEHIAQALFENLKVGLMLLWSEMSESHLSNMARLKSGSIRLLHLFLRPLSCSVWKNYRAGGGYWMAGNERYTPDGEVYHSRPLFHLSRATPLAGRSFHRRLRALLRHHASYFPPGGSSTDGNGVPLEVLTDELIERLLTEACLAGPPLANAWSDSSSTETHGPIEGGDHPSEIDDADLLDRLRTRYEGQTHAKDIRFSIPSPPGSRLPPATLIVPGWLRERAAEVLLGDHETEDVSLVDLILKTMLSLPVDLRRPLISSILIVGGTACLPGLIPRIRQSLLASLTPSSSPSFPTPNDAKVKITPEERRAENHLWRTRSAEPYSALYPLSTKLAVLNDPAPLDTPGEAYNTGGKAPRWTPSLMGWVGGSLAGALKTGGPEMLREDYDTLVNETYAAGEAWTENQRNAQAELADMVGVEMEELEPGMALVGLSNRKRQWEGGKVMRDWTRGGGVTAI